MNDGSRKGRDSSSEQRACKMKSEGDLLARRRMLERDKQRKQDKHKLNQKCESPQSGSQGRKSGTKKDTQPLSKVKPKAKSDRVLRKTRASGEAKERKKKRAEWREIERPKDLYSNLPGICLEEWSRTMLPEKLDTLVQEFDEITANTMTLAGTTKTQACDANGAKNRYLDVKCWDWSRVVLKEEGRKDSDYIHANYIHGWNRPKEYIAAQGPLEGTIKDFWDMAWQEGVVFIVQLCSFVENTKPKCAIYWEKESGGVLSIPPYTILTFQQEDLPIADHKLLISVLKVSKTGHSPRMLYHYFHTNWPDKYFPDTGLPLLQLMDHVRKKEELLLRGEGKKQRPLPPILVHCSAGIGRTGTLIAVDINYQRWILSNKVDIKAVLLEIRKQRNLAVQTVGQYLFTYRCLLENAQHLRLIDKWPLDTFVMACLKKFPPDNDG